MTQTAIMTFNPIITVKIPEFVNILCASPVCNLPHTFKKNPPIIKHNPKIKTATTLNLPLIEFSLNKMKQIIAFKCFTWVFFVEKMLRDLASLILSEKTHL
jgi:hypothetical protein